MINLSNCNMVSRSSFIREKKNETVGGKRILSERVGIFHLY